MSPDEVKQRFVEEIKLRGYDDSYIDKNEEREILQIAIQHGVSIDNARLALVQVCTDESYILESAIMRQIKERVVSASETNGCVDRQTFDAILNTVKHSVQNKKNDREVKKMIVQVMEASGNIRVKRNWFSNWYTSLKKDLGM